MTTRKSRLNESSGLTSPEVIPPPTSGPKISEGALYVIFRMRTVHGEGVGFKLLLGIGAPRTVSELQLILDAVKAAAPDGADHVILDWKELDS